MSSIIKSRTKICLILPALIAGGMERVMSEIANYLVQKTDLEIHLLLLTHKPHFFKILPGIIIHQPDFDDVAPNRVGLYFRTLIYLRRTLRRIGPHSLLSFGSKYNSFVILGSLGLGIKTFLSDRSNPYRNSYFTFKRGSANRHDGFIHFILKQVLYRSATGIIVQTNLAQEIERRSLKHKNVIKIPNPTRPIVTKHTRKNNYILNVGRFTALKNQQLLVEMFSQTDHRGWKLVFAGDGEYMDTVKKRVKELVLEDSVLFLGNVKNIDDYYSISKIFAFASFSEGFPNALAEALTVPLSCIAFDCVAGPKDMIVDGYNGFLVPVNNIGEYIRKLNLLMDDYRLREKFEANSREHMRQFNYEDVMKDFYEVLVR